MKMAGNGNPVHFLQSISSPPPLSISPLSLSILYLLFYSFMVCRFGPFLFLCLCHLSSYTFHTILPHLPLLPPPHTHIHPSLPLPYPSTILWFSPACHIHTHTTHTHYTHTHTTPTYYTPPYLPTVPTISTCSLPCPTCSWVLQFTTVYTRSFYTHTFAFALHTHTRSSFMPFLLFTTTSPLLPFPFPPPAPFLFVWFICCWFTCHTPLPHTHTRTHTTFPPFTPHVRFWHLSFFLWFFAFACLPHLLCGINKNNIK